MDIEQYITQLKGTINKLIEQNEFEVVNQAQELIRILQIKDTKAFINFSFDIKGLTKAGLFKKGMSEFDMAERICNFFGYDNVFQYAVHEGLRCSYERYANGLHEIIRKVQW